MNFIRTSILSLLILASLSIVCFAQAELGYVTKETLPNGLTLIMEEDHSRDIVSACLFVDGGLRIENPEVYGISHFIEHLVFRGPTENLEELELRRKFRQWGDFSGYTSSDQTCYEFTVPTEYFDEALVDFVDGVMNLTIPRSVIEKERSVVTREIHQRKDIPSVRIWNLFNQTALKVHSYANPVIGYEDIIANVPEDTIREYYRNHYAPDQLILTIVGDFDSDHMKSRIQGAFAGYMNSGKDFERGFMEPQQNGLRSAVEKADINSTHILMGWRIPPAGSELSPDFEIFAEILGGGEDSRLYEKLKTELALVDEINAFTYLRKDIGFLSIYVIAQPGNRNDILDAVSETINGFNQSPVTDDEIQRAKRRIENDHSFGLQTYRDKTQYYSDWEVNQNLEMGINWLKLINSVERDDLASLIDEYVKDDNLTWVALVPAEKKPSENNDVQEVQVSQDFSKTLTAGEIISGKLTNHADYIFKKDTSSEIVGISILAGHGQLLEESGKEGISALVARMLDKGNAGMDATEIRRKIEELGLKLDISAQRDFLKINMEIHRDRFIDGVELLNKLIFEPDFPSDEFQIQKKEQLAELARRQENSFTYVNDMFYRNLYGDTPYSYPVEGLTESVESLEVSDLKAFHKKIFAPKTMIVAVAGDLESQLAHSVVNRNLGRLMNLDRSMEEISDLYPVADIPESVRETEIVELPRSQVSLNMGLVGVSADHPDSLSLKILTRVLGLRLFDKYVYELGWSYRMWFYMPTLKGPAPIMYEMGVSGERFDDARTGLIQAMRDIIENPVSEKELDETRNYMIQSFKLNMQKNVDSAYYMAFYEKMGLGYEYIDKIDQMYSDITSEDLSRTAKIYFRPDEMKLAAIVPEK